MPFLSFQLTLPPLDSSFAIFYRQVDLDPTFVNHTDLHILDLSNSSSIGTINEAQTVGGDLLLQEARLDDVCSTFPSPYDNDHRGADHINPDDIPSRFVPDKVS